MEAQAALTWNDLPARVELPKMPFEALLSTCQFLVKDHPQKFWTTKNECGGLVREMYLF